MDGDDGGLARSRAAGTGLSATRFTKGTSGNPAGRPRKVADPIPSAFDIIIDKTLTVTRGGVAREIGVEEALQHKTYQDAIAGSRLARREVLRMILKREKAKAAGRAKRNAPIEQIIEHDTTSANDAMRLLGIISDDNDDRYGSDEYERVLLEPWVVDAALGRRGRRNLARRQLDDIRRCTRDGKALNLPDPID